jgi:hypothetical protein
MKWNILVGSLVLGFCLSTQSFGLDLLDRMLGTNYNGCSDKAASCDTPCADPEPSCGCDTGCDVQSVPCKSKCRKTPLLDLLRGCKKCKKSSCDGGCDTGCADPGCGVEPTCGCENACAAKCTVKKRCRVSLLDRIFGKHCGKKKQCGCAEPACGCEAADPGCGCEPACGCEGGKAQEAAPEAAEPKEAEVKEEKDEVGPAPVVDPSAFLPTQRRFIQTNLVR